MPKAPDPERRAFFAGMAAGTGLAIFVSPASGYGNHVLLAVLLLCLLAVLPIEPK